LKLIPRLSPDIALLDIDLPGMNGFECMKLLKEKLPNIRIIVFSMYEKPNYIIESMKLGANGFISKHLPTEKLIKALKSVYKGDKFICPISLNILKSPVNKVNHPEEELTKKEREILQLIANGYSTKEIAEKTNTSEHTVRTHREHINKKLDLHSPQDLIIYAIHHGIILPKENSYLINEEINS